MNSLFLGLVVTNWTWRETLRFMLSPIFAAQVEVMVLWPSPCRHVAVPAQCLWKQMLPGGPRHRHAALRPWTSAGTTCSRSYSLTRGFALVWSGAHTLWSVHRWEVIGLAPWSGTSSTGTRSSSWGSPLWAGRPLRAGAACRSFVAFFVVVTVLAGSWLLAYTFLVLGGALTSLQTPQHSVLLLGCARSASGARSCPATPPSAAWTCGTSSTTSWWCLARCWWRARFPEPALKACGSG